MMSPDDALQVRQTRDLLMRDALKPGGLCVMTGAGMSAESGIPTFRDAQSGLWSRFKPEDLATVQAVARPARCTMLPQRWLRIRFTRSPAFRRGDSTSCVCGVDGLKRPDSGGRP